MFYTKLNKAKRIAVLSLIRGLPGSVREYRRCRSMPMIDPEVTKALAGIKVGVEACVEGVQLVAGEKVSNPNLCKISFFKEGPVAIGKRDIIGPVVKVLARIVEAMAARLGPANRLPNTTPQVFCFDTNPAIRLLAVTVKFDWIIFATHKFQVSWTGHAAC